MKTSNCCDAIVSEDNDICSDCKEHCGAVDEDKREYTFEVNKWVKEAEPEYAFEYIIKDLTKEEVVLSGSTYVGTVYDGSSESVEMEVGKALRYFEKHIYQPK